MVQRRIVELVDDLDGGTAEETVTFGIDGKLYELDLSATNAAALRKAMAPYIAVGRRAGSGLHRLTKSGLGSGAGDIAVVRSWARENGYQINSRGRIPAPILAAYQAR